MRILSFVFALLLGYCTSVSAQYHMNFPPDLNWEVGINGGFSVCTRPVGPPDAYRGTRTNVVGEYGIRGGYSFNPHWQMNFDLGSRMWETFGTWQINGKYGQVLGPQNISFMVAQRAVSESIQMNYVIPFYTHFQVYNKANLYFGAMFGMVTTVNDGSQTVSRYKSPVDSSVTNFVSRVDYNSGIGYSYGIQTGFSYFFVPKLGLNIEFAVRYANVTTSDTHNSAELQHYHLLYFPETIGLRYRF